MKKEIIFALTYLIVSCTSAQIITNQQRLADIDNMLQQQKLMLDNRASLVFGFLEHELPVNEMQSMKFLYAYMPLSDLADYSNEFFLENVRYSLKALEEIPWTKTVPEDEFLHFVLPVRVNNENLDSFRIVCYQELSERVKGMSMYDAALEVNHWCHEYVTYKASDSRTSSPLNTMKYSFGRCGEESVFTVAAMRAVGIPARQVYTPRWAHSDDNHAWVEVWIDGKWHYLGACEPEPELNMGWFSFPASRAMLVHTRAYGTYFGKEEVIIAEERFAELNLISNYAETKSLTVKVYDHNGNPYQGVSVDVLLYNYAELYPIATKTTTQNGFTSITLGLGEVIIWATDGKLYNFEHIQVANTDTVHIQLGIKHAVPLTKHFHFTPPLGKFVEPYSGEKADITRKRLVNEDSLRAVYMSTFKDSLQSVYIAKELGYNPDIAADYIYRSYGNHENIVAFLSQAPEHLRHQALLLLSVISEKDLRDATANVLLDHLLSTTSLETDFHQGDEAMYAGYVLNGRIANEQMVAWKSHLSKELFFELFGETLNPAFFEKWVKNNIAIDNTVNLHSRAPITPVGVLKLRVADNLSRDIFFVALCRMIGFPARLHPETRIPQYYFANQWNNVWFDNETDEIPETSTVFFSNPMKRNTDKYYNTFTLSRLEKGRYQTLRYPWGMSLNELEEKPQEVFAGDYLMVRGSRLSEGTVLAELDFFHVEPGSTVRIHANAPQLPVSAASYGKIKLKNIVLPDFDNGEPHHLNQYVKNKILLVFIDPDREPSKHVMHDLALVKNQLEESGISIFYILSPAILSPTFHSGFFKGMPKQGKYLLDEHDKLFNLVASKSNDKALPVVCLISPKRRIIFLSNGYRIGTGDEILRILKR
jgi:hypothetical protein